MWEQIKLALSGLLFEHGSGRLSVGRVAFWPVLAVALWTWGVEDQEIQHYHFLTLVLLLVYNTGTKMLDTLRAVKEFASGIGVNVPKLPVKEPKKKTPPSESETAGD